MAAIHFLNPAPLMWDFEHEPGLTRLASRYQIGYTTPSHCAAQLAQNEADIGLIPVAAYASIPALRIVPGCTVASLGRVRSILLVVRAATGLGSVRTVAADTSSLTSFTYARIMFNRYWKIDPQILRHGPDLDAMLAIADAALLIGDPALLALEKRQLREQQTGERLVYLDLAEEWHNFTGTPWVSAFWAVRSGVFQKTGVAAEEVVADLQGSLDHGLEQIDALVEEWSPRIQVPAETIRTYLTKNIHYRLDEACLRGLSLFYRLAAECGVLPRTEALSML